MRKILYLEGIRGIAALIVVVAHFLQYFYFRLFNDDNSTMHNSYETWFSETPLNIFYNGNFAVTIFFVLSGYVLSLKFFKEKNLNIIYEMVIKRYFRLLIPVAVSVIITYIVIKLNAIHYYDIVEYTKAKANDAFVIEHNFLELLKYITVDVFFLNEDHYNPALWTMYYELIGSFIVFATLPLVIKLTNFYMKTIFYLIIMLIAAALFSPYITLFLMGMWLCDLDIDNTLIKNWNYSWVNLSILVIALYFGSYPYVDTSGTVYEVLSILPGAFLITHIIGAFLLVLVAIRSKLMQKLFSNKIFEFLGKISFSLYLIHFVVIYSLSSYLFKVFIGLGLSYNFSFILMFIISITLILIVSYVMYKYVDRFAVKISKGIYLSLFKCINKKFKV